MNNRSKAAFAGVLSVALAASLFPVSFNTGTAEQAQIDEQAFAVEEVSLEQKAKEANTDKLAEVDETAEQLVSDYFDARSDEVEGKSGVAQDENVNVDDAVAETSEQRAEGLEQMAQQANFNVVKADTTVQVDAVEHLGDSLKVDANEYTILEYDDLADGPGGKTDIAIFGTPHEMVLEKQDDGYQIATDAYYEEDISGVDTSESDPALQGQEAAADAIGSYAQALSVEQADAATVTYDEDYNPALAIAYSDRYTWKYNPSYHNFNPDGGDCANFTSQCIYAGGFKQVKGNYGSSKAWYYKSDSDYTSSWVYCPTFVSFFKRHGKYVNITATNEKSAAAVYPGSPVVYMSSTEWSHAVFCVGYNSAGTPVINSHNRERYHVPYSYWSPAKRCTIQLTKENTASKVFSTATYNGEAAAQTSSSSSASQVDSEQGEIQVEGNPYIWIAISDTEVGLSAYTGHDTKITVGPTVKDAEGNVYKVKGIWDGVFEGQPIKSLTVAGGVTSIGMNAFKGCKKLKSVNFGNSVTSVAQTAFSGCTALKSLSGCAKLKTVQTSAFSGCTKLASIDSLAKAKTLMDGAFSGCTSLAALPALPAIKTTGANVFKGCTKLASLPSMPKLVTLGADAFSNCTALTSIPSLPKLATIGAGAFRNCSNLKSVAAFPKLKTLGSDAFRNCDALGAVPSMPVVSTLGNRSFCDCDGIVSAAVASPSLKSIGSSAFSSCNALATVKISSKKLAKIKKRAFKNCTSLKKMTLKTSAIKKQTSIGADAFTGVYAKAKVNVPNKKAKTYRKWFRARGLAKSAKVK